MILILSGATLLPGLVQLWLCGSGTTVTLRLFLGSPQCDLQLWFFFPSATPLNYKVNLVWYQKHAFKSQRNTYLVIYLSTGYPHHPCSPWSHFFQNVCDFQLCNFEIHSAAKLQNISVLQHPALFKTNLGITLLRTIWVQGEVSFGLSGCSLAVGTSTSMPSLNCLTKVSTEHNLWCSVPPSVTSLKG